MFQGPNFKEIIYKSLVFYKINFSEYYLLTGLMYFFPMNSMEQFIFLSGHFSCENIYFFNINRFFNFDDYGDLSVDFTFP